MGLNSVDFGKQPGRRWLFLLLFLFLAMLCHDSWAMNPFAHRLKSMKMKDGGAGYELGSVARFYGFSPQYPGAKSINMVSKWTALLLEADSRKLDANGLLIWLHEPVTYVKKRMVIHEDDMHKILDPLLRPDIYLASEGYSLVLLDPGHGGNDPGAIGLGNIKEKDVVLDIARQTAKILKKQGIRVDMTRDRDTYVSLADRCRKVKSTRADVFVSIHLNATDNQSAEGCETYIMTAAGHESTHSSGSNKKRLADSGNRYDGASMVLGYYLHRGLTQIWKDNDRGLKRARYYVLKKAECPAALVECGFLSNDSDRSRLKSAARRHQIAEVLAEGISDYLAAIKRAKLTVMKD
ncbi:MAG: N-acetylmuramoyl-L-alanine amidase [Spartobacteria bacterium]|nr:N-acetylmuramoyl-L-alanine amidase [Spartobacteria bacterium]